MPLAVFMLVDRMRETYGVNIHVEVVDRSLLSGASSHMSLIDIGGSTIALDCESFDENSMTVLENTILLAIATYHRPLAETVEPLSTASEKKPPLESLAEVGD